MATALRVRDVIGAHMYRLQIGFVTGLQNVRINTYHITGSYAVASLLDSFCLA